MSGGADTQVETLLVVVEPAGGDAAATAARVALVAEAGRLAAALGATTRIVTWPADPDIDPAALATAVAAVAASASPTAVLIQDGDAGRQLAPLVAQRLATCAVLGCSDVRPAPEGLIFTKPVYGGWLEEEVRPADGFVPVATLDLDGLEPPEPAAAHAAAALAQAEILQLRASVATGTAPGTAPRVRTVKTVPPDARSVDLVHAKRIVTAGIGAADDGVMAAVAELAELLQGSVGATRPVVDEGRLPKERLIGQTGRTVAPELYLALGVSGSPHHVAGVRKADRVLAVNRDLRAPIFQFSDVGYVADLRDVLPALIERIKAWRDAPVPAAPGGGSGGESDVQ